MRRERFLSVGVLIVIVAFAAMTIESASAHDKGCDGNPCRSFAGGPPAISALPPPVWAQGIDVEAADTMSGIRLALTSRVWRRRISNGP